MSLKKIIRKNIEDNAVTEPKLANEAVTAEKLGTDFITGLDELTSVAENDNLLISDTSAGVLKKVTKANTTSLATPTFSSVSPDNSQTADGGNITFTITGTGFTTGTNARLFGASGQRLNFDSVTRSSTTSITATIARSSLLLAQSPYGIQVINGEGSAVTAASQISIDTVPIFNTSAGSLGTFTEGESIDVEVSAYDPDSTSAITYELQSGSLPAGLSLVNQSGDSCRIQGTASAVSADTTSNFTLRATDSASNTTSRAFSITIEDFALNGLRFDDGSTDYLSKTFSSSPTGNTKATVSVWWKRSAIGNTGINNGEQTLISWNTGLGNRSFLRSEGSTDQLNLRVINNSGDYGLQITPVQRDPSAWMHIVGVIDTTQATSSNRMKLYINGSQITVFDSSSYPNQNETNIGWGEAEACEIGRDVKDSNTPLDGYLSEFIFIDGQALDPTSFGETDSNGVWIPKAYSGSFGTNGFHLDFADSADLGNDVSGNNNDFTENNLTSIDKVEDTPQNNYATLNPLYRYDNNPTYSDGNLNFSGTGNTWQGANSTFYINTGKWFYEVKINSGTAVANYYFGWTTAGDYNTAEPYNNGIHFYNSDGGEIYANSIALTTADYGTFGNGDILGLALDYDNSLLSVYKNGTALFTEYNFSSATTTAKGGNYVTPTIAHYGTGNVLFNFGNPPFTISSGNSDGNGYGNFEYAVPSGYYALNTKNLAEYG